MSTSLSTVEGELGVANFIDNFFNNVGLVGCGLCGLYRGGTFEEAELAVICSFLPFPSRQSQPFSGQPQPWHPNWML